MTADEERDWERWLDEQDEEIAKQPEVTRRDVRDLIRILERMMGGIEYGDGGGGRHLDEARMALAPMKARFGS